MVRLKYLDKNSVGGNTRQGGLLSRSSPTGASYLLNRATCASLEWLLEGQVNNAITKMTLLEKGANQGGSFLRLEVVFFCEL
jgi:hypothetical protein